LQILDQRESRYRKYQVKFYHFPYRDDTEPFDILVYVANQENPNFAQNNNDLSEIATQIFKASGQGGENKHYLYTLADFMRNSFPNEKDDHLFEIERILRRMDCEKQ
jgi:cation transport regulator ChaC